MFDPKKVALVSLALVVTAFVAGAWLYKRDAAQAQSGLARGQPEQVIRADAARYGSADAKVTIVEFFDPACEACRAYYPLVKQIVNTSFGRVSLVLRYAPLHQDSDQAALMLEATRRQDKFWPAVEAALAAQDRWASHDKPDIAQLWTALAAAGIDIERVRADMRTEAVTGALAQDMAALTALKVQRTPTFYVNGKPLVDFGAQQLKTLVSSEVKAAYGD